MKLTKAISVVAIVAVCGAGTPLSASSQNLGRQIKEVELLLKEKKYITALEDLRFIAQQIQELRLAEILHFFPIPPPGWEADTPVRTSSEGDLWSRRLEARKKYYPESGTGKVECVFDFFSPLIPEAALSLNPVYISGDPRTEKVKFEGNPGRLTFNTDTGEGELLVIIDNRILLSITGRGISSRSVLKEFASRLDYRSLENIILP